MDKILLLGNSYSEDLEMYFPEICSEFGKEIEITSLAYPSCTIDQHMQFLANDEQVYIVSNYNFISRRWDRKYNVSANEIIDSKEWDFIVIQQASYLAGDVNAFDKINDFLDLLKSHISLSKTKVLWQMTWAYPHNGPYDIFNITFKKDPQIMYNFILQNVQNYILTNPRIFKVIPTGTAVMNILTYLPEDGVYRDIVHLSYHVGRYVASLTFAKMMYDFDLSNLQTEPFSIPLKDKAYCIQSAIDAVNNPYHISSNKK